MLSLEPHGKPRLIKQPLGLTPQTPLSRRKLERSGSSPPNQMPQEAGFFMWWAPLTLAQSVPGAAAALPE